MNDDYSQFFDANSQICLNEESFVAQQTPQNKNVQMISIPGSEKVMKDQHTASHFRTQSNQQAFHYQQPQLSDSKQNSNIQDAKYSSNQNQQQQQQQQLIDIQKSLEQVKHQESSPVKITDVELGLIDMSEIKASTPPDQSDSVLVITANNEAPSMFKLEVPQLQTDRPIHTNPVANYQTQQVQIQTQRVQSQVLQQQESGAQTTKSASNTTWQKVTFAKRRVSNNLVNGQGENNNNQTQVKQSSGNLTHENVVRILQKQNTMIAPAKSKQDLIKEKLKKKNLFQDGEPLPVFDCLFCCQEHFVLNKINELSLVNKYANYRIGFEIQRNALMIAMEMKGMKGLGKCRVSQEIVDANPIIRSYGEISKVHTLTASLNELSNPNHKIERAKPLVIKLQQALKTIKQMQSTAHQLPLQTKVQNQKTAQQKPQSNFLGMTDEDDGMLGNFQDESNAFGLVHFRTRRQRILQQISFESECYNIYDPCFTSEEERDSINIETSKSSVSCENDNEVDEESLEDESYSDEEQSLNTDSISQQSEVGVEAADDEDEEELKEIVNEYQRSEERKKRAALRGNNMDDMEERVSLSPSPIKMCEDEPIKSNVSHGNQSISSIEQQSDEEEGFTQSDNDEVVHHEVIEVQPQQTLEEYEVVSPVRDLTNYRFTAKDRGCATNPLSFINATTSNHVTSNNLNIQENTIEKAEEEDDSERYTFGCVTPKGEGETMGPPIQGQQKLTFTNFQGDNSLSPVRRASQSAILVDRPLQLRASQPSQEYYDQVNSSVTQKNPLMFDISPVSCNVKKSFIGDGSKQDGAQHTLMINSINEGENLSMRDGKIDFYPAIQDIDSIEMHITQGPILIQQKSYEEVFQMNHQLSKTADPNSLEFNLSNGVVSIANQAKRLSQFSKSYQSDILEEDQIQHDQVLEQYYNNERPPLVGDQQSRSFTTTGHKYKHQRLIPSYQMQSVVDSTPDNRQSKQPALAQTTMKTQFLMKQEQFQEILKKAKKMKSKQQFKVGNPMHLQSFDSIQNPQMRHQQSIQDQEGRALFKQQTQTICTPIDTNDQVMLAYTQKGKIQNKTNKTTINQNSRRQGLGNGNLLSGQTCKNGSASEQNLLLKQDGPVPATIFTNRKMTDFNSTNTVSAAKQSSKKSQQRLNDPMKMQLMQAYDHQTNPTNGQTTVKSQTKKQKTQSPSIMKLADVKGSSFATNNYFGPNLQHLNVNQLSKKEINQFLKSALLSSRYATTAAGSLFKNVELSSHQESISQSNQKKKKKSTTKQNKNQTLTSTGIQEVKKQSKTKKGTKKGSKQSKLQNDLSSHLGNQHQSQQDLQAYINICNSMNFSNDYSIPSIISGNANPKPITLKSISMNQGHPNNKSSQNALMYLSMQDGKNIFSAGNNTNIQDTSNNFPYSGFMQAEMSTCISNGCNSNQLTQLQHTISSNRGVKRDHSQKPEVQKLNGSLEEVNLFNLLSGLGNTRGKDPQRSSVCIQKGANYNHQTSIERAVVQGSALNPPETDQKAKPATVHHNHGQFSFSQRDFVLNQTTDLKSGLHKKRKSKGSQGGTSITFNGITHSSNLPSHFSTTKNTTVQNKRRDNQLRTRSSSKSSHAIKTDQPTHQLLLQNQINLPLQMKNRQVLMSHQTVQPPSTLTKKELNATLNKTKKGLVQDDTTTRQKNQSRQSNKSNIDKPHQQMSNLQSQQDLAKLYGTGKILMSSVTSPLRPLAANFASGVGYSMDLGHDKGMYGIVKSDLFQTRESHDFKK